jgi:cytochrome oxidase Cu insertion factor (SCO1/SenC/PrrC family)
MREPFEGSRSGPQHRIDRPGTTGPVRRGRLLVPVLIATTVTLFLAGAAIIAVGRHNAGVSHELRASGIPANVPTGLANEMLLTPVPERRAPEFTLVDQEGRPITLESFRGKVVVLEFMDPHCTDICPIVSQEFLDANRDLGGRANRVVFLAVNVNQYHARVADMMAFSREQGLVSLQSWHFLTGSVPILKKIWHDYAVEVEAPNHNADIIHTSIVYFIDKNGIERYVGSPMDDHTAKGTAYLPASQLSSWGRGMALVVKDLSS